MAAPTLVASLRKARWSVIVGVWTVVSLFDFVRAYLYSRWSHGPLPSLRWMALSLASNELWALVTPLLFWVAFRFPVDRTTWRRHFPVHVLAWLATTLLDTAVIGAVEGAFPGRPPSPFAARYASQLLLDGFTYSAVAALAHAARYRDLYLERALRASELEGQLARARLSALEMQLKPHFLFNTLHSVASLVRVQRNDDAVQMIAELGALLRAALERDGAPEVPLEEELSFTSRYLAIQRIRFEDRLRVAMAVEPDVRDALVPHLILQPLVENAVRHAVEESAAPVLVEICARADGERLILAVRDSGCGQPDGARRDGVGLGNTRARLQALYGEQQRLELRAVEPGGAEARLEIPLRRRAAARNGDGAAS
jgi:two-component system, LytTR family, sensor kinase